MASSCQASEKQVTSRAGENNVKHDRAVACVSSFCVELPSRDRVSGRYPVRLLCDGSKNCFHQLQGRSR